MSKLEEDPPSAEPAEQDAPVPKLPRGTGFKLSTPQLMRIGMTVVTLIAIVALQKPCSNAVGRFVTTFGGGDEAASPSGQEPGAGQPGPAVPPPGAGNSAAPTVPPAASTVTGPDRGAPAGAPPIQYERLSPSMTDAELRAAIERAKRRAAAAEAAKGTTPSTAPPAPSPVPPPTPSPPPVPSSAGSGGQ